MKKINKTIKQEINEFVPNVSENIVNSIDWNKVSVNNAPVTKKKTSIFSYVLLPALSMFAFCLAFLVPFSNMHFKNNTNNYVLTLSINPSIELKANESQIVTSQKGLNEEGVLLLLKQNLVGETLEDATNKIVELSNELGYLTEGKDIKLMVKTDKGKQIPETHNKLKQCINNCIKSFSFNNMNIINLSANELNDLENYYVEHNMPAFETNITQSFNQTLLDLSRQKLFDTNELLIVLNSYAAKNNNNIIPHFYYARERLEKYALKYNYKLFKYDLGKLTYANVYEIYCDLKKCSAELFNTIVQLQQEQREDFYNKLEDLFNMAKNAIKNEVDNDINQVAA